MKFTAGSRGSNLALFQTNWVISLLNELGHQCDVKIIKTKGDKILDKALDKIGDKGLFVKELEEEILSGTVDFAVHSYKDMPTTNPNGLIIVDIPKREIRSDVLILNKKYKSLSDVPAGETIGTGSKRRVYQLNSIRNDLKTYPVRGNIETRLRKIEDENLAGIILASAALKRLELSEHVSYEFKETEMVPAPAQGAIAIQIREDRTDLIEIFSKISNQKDNEEVRAERYFMKIMEGGCHSPIGASALVEDESIIMTCLFGNEDGSKLIRKTVTSERENWMEMVEKTALSIKKELNND